MSLRISDHSLSGIKIIERQARIDARGYFLRVWDKAALAEHGIVNDWVQENQAFSVKAHTLRGLHFQRPPYAEAKFIRCVTGRILDVFVDIRKGSPTYGKSGTVELDSNAHKMVLVPRGFAHGYLTLTDGCLVTYKTDAAYKPEAEGGLRWDDPALGITWPSKTPILSDKDKALPVLSGIEPIALLN